MILQREGEVREEIDLKRPRQDRTEAIPPSKPQEELPPSICPDGSPLSLWQHQSREYAPGTSPLDTFPPVAPSAPPRRETSEEEGGAQ